MRSWLVLVLIPIGPISAGADAELGLALKGGPNAATLSEDGQVSRYGFTGGIAGSLAWWPGEGLSLAAQLEVLYTPRGAEVVLEGEYLGRARSHYLDTAFSIRPEVRLGRASAYLLLGGGLSLLASASKEDASGFEVDITADLRRVDVALLVGLGAAWRLPRRALGPFRLGSVFVEARHDRGVLVADAVNGGYKNRTTSFMAGLSFMLGSGAVSPSSVRVPASDRAPALAPTAAE